MREYGVPLIVVALLAVGAAGMLYVLRAGRPVAMPWEEPEREVEMDPDGYGWARPPGIAFE